MCEQQCCSWLRRQCAYVLVGLFVGQSSSQGVWGTLILWITLEVPRVCKPGEMCWNIGVNGVEQTMEQTIEGK